MAGSQPQPLNQVSGPGGGDLAGFSGRLKPKRARPAAVLVPLLDDERGLRVLLTRRAAHLKHHPGQISFPGGRIEPADEGPVDAALRETHEEVGIGREDIEIVGFLDNYLTITGYTVTPIVGVIRECPTLTLDANEVAEAFTVPLAHLFDPTQHRRRTRRVMGVDVQIYEILWEQHRIWGATAAMIVAMFQAVSRSDA